MTLTGIKEVSSLNEQKIVLLTEMDQLTITGRSMRLKSFSPKTGDLRVDGTIDSLVYGSWQHHGVKQKIKRAKSFVFRYNVK